MSTTKLDFRKKATCKRYLIQNSDGATMYSYLTESVRDERVEYLRKRYPKTEYTTKEVMK